MADDFYPFVDNGAQAVPGVPERPSEATPLSQSASQAGGTAAPSLDVPVYPARIAVYDDMEMSPRVVVVDPKGIREYLAEITSTTYDLVTQQGGTFAFSMIRELVENYIHAAFIEPTISILDRGQTIVFSDQGPGIPNKRDAMRPSFTSATRAMKKYIRGVGSGLPIVEEYIRRNNGTLTIEDNLGHGTIVTVSLVRKNGAPTESTAPSPQGTPGRGAFAPETPSAATPQANAPVGFPATTGYGTPAQYPAAQPGSPWPYGAPSQEMGAGIAAGQQAYPSRYPGYGTQAAGGWAAAYPQSQWGASPSYPGSVPGYPGGAGAYPTSAPGYPAIPPADNQALPGYPVQPAGYGAPGSQAGIPNQMTVLPVGTGYPTGSYAGAPGTTGELVPQASAAATSMAPLSDEQIAILSLFGRHESIGPKELENELGIPKATGSRRLAALQKKGCAIKQGQKYLLTDAGRQVVSQLGPLTNGNR